MRRVMTAIVCVAIVACFSSREAHDDLGNVVVTESKADVSHCVFLFHITAVVDLRLYEGDRDAAMAEAMVDLRNNALKHRCDTVLLTRIRETTHQIKLEGEGFTCEGTGIAGDPRLP